MQACEGELVLFPDDTAGIPRLSRASNHVLKDILTGRAANEADTTSTQIFQGS
jgi:hypothetical protein